MKDCLLIVTAGISLFENLSNPSKEFNETELVQLFRFKGAGAWRKFLKRAPQQRDYLKQFAGHIAHLNLSDDGERNRSTAEIASYYLMRQSNAYDNVRLVVLCSDTGQGAFCAMVNAMLLAREVRYFKSFSDHRLSDNESQTIQGFAPEELPHGLYSDLESVRLDTVDLVIVDKLNPNKAQTFAEQALPNLVEIITKLYCTDRDDYQDERVILNYTGGYKAAIPTITQAVALLGDIDLMCLYEESAGLVKQPLMVLQLPKEKEIELLNAGKGGAADVTTQGKSFGTFSKSLDSMTSAFYCEEEAGNIGLTMFGRSLQVMLETREIIAKKQQDA